MVYYNVPPPAFPGHNFLQSVFQGVDHDRSGSIKASELQSAISNGTWTLFNPEKVRMMIGMFDRDNSGIINFDEFGALCKYVTDWQKCFKSFDRDNSGKIDQNELQNALQTFGYRLTSKSTDKILKKFDRQENGTVTFDDFFFNFAYLCMETLTAPLRKHDTDMNGIIQIHYEIFH